MLELFQMAPKPPQLVCGKFNIGAVGIDVVKCRRKALTENQFPLPRFNVQDKWEDWDIDSPDADFYYVDDGPVSNDDLPLRLPYHGPGVYWKFAWREDGFPRGKTQKYLKAS